MVELVGGPADGRQVEPTQREFGALRILDEHGMFFAIYRWERDADGDVIKGVFDRTLYPEDGQLPEM